MTTASDAHFWDRASEKYSKSKISDQAGYEHTLERTRALLKSNDRVLELGCGTGTTALRLADAAHSYLATDISPKMIAIAEEKRAANPKTSLSFQVATAKALTSETEQFDAVLGFNYLHLVRDLPGTLRSIHTLLVSGGLFISKTPCLGNMNPLIRLVMLPAMRLVGKAPYVDSFRASDLGPKLEAAGFEILTTENHASSGKDTRPYIVARKR